MDISIIIVNYNTLKITKDCIDSIVAQTHFVNYEIILVDNNSTDGSREYFDTRSDIKYVYSNTNLGFGRANNLGLNYANGKFIFLLNSDTILCNNSLYEFYKYAVACKEFGCLGCQLFAKDGSLSPSFGYFLTIKRVLKDCLMSYLKFFCKFNIKVTCDVNLEYIPEMIIGAALFIRKETIEKYGMFDERYFMYHEENDMERRYSLNGLKNIIIPGPRIIHLESQSTLLSFNKVVMSTSSLFIYIKKWNSNLSYYLFRIIYFFLRVPFVLSSKLDCNQKLVYLKLLMQ